MKASLQDYLLDMRMLGLATQVPVFSAWRLVSSILNHLLVPVLSSSFPGSDMNGALLPSIYRLYALILLS